MLFTADKIIKHRDSCLKFKKAVSVQLDTLVGAAAGRVQQSLVGATNSQKAGEIQAQSSFTRPASNQSLALSFTPS